MKRISKMVLFNLPIVFALGGAMANATPPTKIDKSKIEKKSVVKVVKSNMNSANGTQKIAKVEMEVSGWTGSSQTDEFVKDLSRFKGVEKVERKEFRKGVLFVELMINPKAIHRLPLSEEVEEISEKYHFVITTCTELKMTGRIQKEFASSAEKNKIQNLADRK